MAEKYTKAERLTSIIEDAPNRRYTKAGEINSLPAQFSLREESGLAGLEGLEAIDSDDQREDDHRNDDHALQAFLDQHAGAGTATSWFAAPKSGHMF